MMLWLPKSNRNEASITREAELMIASHLGQGQSLRLAEGKVEWEAGCRTHPMARVAPLSCPPEQLGDKSVHAALNL